MAKSQLILITALLLLTSGVVAQQADTEIQQETTTSELGENVIASNFVMRGVPGSNQEEVEADRSFETEADSDESYNLTEEEALETAREELGSSEWDLEDSEQSEGLYEFEFARGESEAEVSVDGSSGRIVEFEAEVEWEPENDEPSAVMTGFIQFSREGYEVDTDTDVDEENREALFEVEIEQQDEIGAEVINQRQIREFEEAEPGEYTGTVQVIRDDEVVFSDQQQFRVPGPEENESEGPENEVPEETEEDESEENETEEETEEESQTLEEMSRDELIEEVRSLREQIETLREESDSENSQRPETPQGPPEDTPPNSGEEPDSEESETDEPEDEEQSNESQRPTEAPGNSDQRPGFVNRMLSGIFS